VDLPGGCPRRHHIALSPGPLPFSPAIFPQVGTDTANLQIVNAIIETAFNDRKPLYGSRWDIKQISHMLRVA